MVLSPAFLYMKAHGLDYGGETVTADMGMGVNPDHGVGAEIRKGFQDSTDISPLVGTGIELAVRECSGPALPETVVGVRVETACTGYGGYIVFAFVDVPAPLENYRTAAAADEPERGEKSGRARSDDYYRRFLRDILLQVI